VNAGLREKPREFGVELVALAWPSRVVRESLAATGLRDLFAAPARNRPKTRPATGPFLYRLVLHVLWA
jgi:hypothetical protein